MSSVDSRAGRSEMYFIFMDYDPQYKRLRSDRSKRGAYELDDYVSKKHDDLLASILEPGSYKKTLSLVIVDGFAAEISEDQARLLRSAKGVRVGEKNQEIVWVGSDCLNDVSKTMAE